MEENTGRAVLQSHRLGENDDCQFNDDPSSDTADTKIITHSPHACVTFVAC